MAGLQLSDEDQERLRASEQRLAGILDSQEIFVRRVDPQFRLTYMNQVYARAFKLRIGDGMFTAVHPDDAERARTALANLQQPPYRSIVDLRNRIQGEWRWVRWENNFIRNTHGELVEIQGVGIDISEWKRAEAALRESHALLVATERLAGIGGFQWDIASGVVAWSDEVYRMFGRAPQEGAPSVAAFIAAVHRDDRRQVQDAIAVAEKDRAANAEHMRQRIAGEVAGISYQFTGRRADGSTIEIGVHGARATHNGRPAVIGMMQDISEKKRADEKIQLYFAQLEKAFMSTVEVATTLSEMRDPYTAGHEKRVAGIAVAIGAELGFDAHRQEGLRVAGYLHDIGKITIPSEILSKPGKLSSGEFMLIKGHPQASYDVLKGVEFPWPVAEVALQHHERIDGSGYPQGLKGEAILLEARIMSVADVVEAMASHRPYRPGLGIDKALAEIERGRGTAYDTEVADACLTLFREKGYAIPA